MSPVKASPTSKPKSRYSFTERGLILVVVAYASLLILGPLVAMTWGALSEGPGRFWNEISSADAVHALKLSLLLAAGSTVINTFFGLTIAWVLVRHRFRGRHLLNGLVDLPFAVSPVIAGLMLIVLFGRNGWFRPVIDSMGVEVLFAWPGMLLATIFVSLPFVIREVMPILEQVGTQPEEAAYTLGAGPWQTFLRVSLPAVCWGLLYGVSLTLARALGEFGAVLVVSGGVSGLTETATLFIFRSLDDRNYVGAYSMALVLALISFVILMLMEFFKAHRSQS